jgi:hypothetical protein
MPPTPARPSKLATLARWMRAGDAPASLSRRIFWTGFLIRVLYMTLAHTYRFRTFDNHFEFGWEMGRIGRALATGHGFANPFNGNSGPTAWTPPLYPLLIGAVFKIFGVYTLKSSWVILTINSIFSAATAVAIYEIALRCFTHLPSRSGLRSSSGLQPAVPGTENFGASAPGPVSTAQTLAPTPDPRSIALWSAWLWALYPAAMQYAVRWIWDMALTAFFFSAILVLALRLRNIGDSSQPTTRNLQPATLWGLFGLFWGLIALSNSSLLTFLPVSGLWIIWPTLFARSSTPGAPFVTVSSSRVGSADATDLRRPSLPQTLLGPILSALIFLAVITPWSVRNYAVFHAFIPMRSNFGAELYQATLFSTDGFPWGATLPMAEHAPDFQRFERLGEVGYSREQGAIAKARIHAHPSLFIRNTIRRVYFFWISVPHDGDSGLFVEAVRRINFCFFSFTGILGLALALRRHIPAAWLFFWAFAICPFVYYFVTAQARFRHPLEPIICILSVYLFQSADRTRAFSPRHESLSS